MFHQHPRVLHNRKKSSTAAPAANDGVISSVDSSIPLKESNAHAAKTIGGDAGASKDSGVLSSDEHAEKSGRKNRAKTAERRAQTAGRVRKLREQCAKERRDHLQRAGLERFRGVVKKLQQRKDLMLRLKRESQEHIARKSEAEDEAKAAIEAEMETLCFSLDDAEPEPEPDHIPSMEEYLERVRATAPVA